MMAMCRELEMAWKCVEASLDGMKQNKKRKLYTLLMHGIKRAVEDKCKRKLNIRQLTPCLPVLSADNLGKQFGPRSGPTIRRT